MLADGLISVVASFFDVLTDSEVLLMPRSNSVPCSMCDELMRWTHSYTEGVSAHLRCRKEVLPVGNVASSDRFSTVYMVECVVCSGSFTVSGVGRPAKYCSLTCRSRDKRVQDGSYRGSYSVTCERCGVTVSKPEHNGARARFCSTRCQANSGWDRRRAREKGAFVEDFPRWAVFERDGFACQICGDPLDMNAVAPDSKSPSIDHIIPISRGGKHEFSAVQAAHLGCNARKSDWLAA